jgi:hypothetical protein
MAISTGAAILGGAALGLVGTRMASGAAKSGAQAQAGATQQAANLQAEVARENIALQREMYEKGLELGAPYREAGYGALTRIGELLPGLTSPVTQQEIAGLPGFQFAMEQGTGAARQMANVGGGGSNIDRAAQKFAIDYTTGVAMPQVLAQRSSIYNTLAGIAGIGQTGTAQAIQGGQQAGANIANIAGSSAGAIGQLGVAGANALASGNVASANLLSSGLNNIGNAAFMYSLLNKA